METLWIISTIVGSMLLTIAVLCFVAPVIAPFISFVRGNWNWREVLVLLSMLSMGAVFAIAGYALVFMQGD
jgi:hypothetical protein